MYHDFQCHHSPCSLVLLSQLKDLMFYVRTWRRLICLYSNSCFHTKHAVDIPEKEGMVTYSVFRPVID